MKPQWLLNLGGAVQTAPHHPSGTNSLVLTESSNGMYVAVNSGGGSEPAPGFDRVLGGLVVPFYVIVLAMLGAGINMTKKVPAIQKEYNVTFLAQEPQGVVQTALTAPLAPFVPGAMTPQTPQQKLISSGIRKELIDNYMYLLSAPFLGIAVYYTLQVIGNNTSESVLVIVSFGTGFTSDAIVASITTFANGIVQSLKPNSSQVAGATAEVPAPATPP